VDLKFKNGGKLFNNKQKEPIDLEKEENVYNRIGRVKFNE
jgi:hypothetical protein